MILEQFKKDFKLNENDLFIIQYIIEHSEEITSYLSSACERDLETAYCNHSFSKEDWL